MKYILSNDNDPNNFYELDCKEEELLSEVLNLFNFSIKTSEQIKEEEIVVNKGMQAREKTSLQCFVETSYSNLFKLLGDPILPSGEEQFRVLWTIDFPDGTFCYIYDWDSSEQTIGNVSRWHVSGRTDLDLDNLSRLLDAKCVLP